MSDPIHVWGFIKNGDKKSGSGFSVTDEDKTGVYSITFNDAYADKPSVVASAVDDADNLRTVVLDDIATTGFKARIKNKNNERKNGDFCFIAVGN